jgi:putative hydrolase of the HAD superfamily
MTEAVLFDLDDTLYPYPPCRAAGRDAAHDRVRELGYDLDRAAFEDLFEAGRRAAKRDLPGAAATHSRLLYLRAALREHAGTERPADARACADAFWDAYLAAMAPFDGVHETLGALREAGVAVAVVTNLTTRVQVRKLEALGVADAVDRLVTSEEVGVEKPAAAPFTAALAALDVAPSDALVVGNAPSTDVAGGNAVGAETALFNERDRAIPPDGEPDHRLSDVAAVREVAL